MAANAQFEKLILSLLGANRLLGVGVCVADQYQRLLQHMVYAIDSRYSETDGCNLDWWAKNWQKS